MIARRFFLTAAAACLALFVPLAFVHAQAKPTEKDRVIKAYAHLMKAGQLAQPKEPNPFSNAGKPASALTPAELKRASLDALHDVLSASGHESSEALPDLYAYMKNAQLCLIENREEPHADHVKWAKAHQNELFRSIRTLIREVSDAVKAFDPK